MSLEVLTYLTPQFKANQFLVPYFLFHLEYSHLQYLGQMLSFSYITLQSGILEVELCILNRIGTIPRPKRRKERRKKKKI